MNGYYMPGRLAFVSLNISSFIDVTYWALISGLRGVGGRLEKNCFSYPVGLSG